MSSEFKHDIDALLVKLLENDLTDSEIDALNQWMENDPNAITYYCDYLKNYGLINNSINGNVALNDNFIRGDLDQDIWDKLIEYERIAPSIDIPKDDKPKVTVSTVVEPTVTYEISKFNMVMFIMSAAVLFFVVLLVNFAPERPKSIEVATLVDQFNVKWAKSDKPLKTGSRLQTQSGTIHLNEGIVRIQYDEGVDVVIEGPAAFKMERSGINLDYGHLYSHVDKTALGFTVTTPTSLFVDLGTEFGVCAEPDGSSELHVIKGMVRLFVSMKGGGRTSQMLTNDQASRYNANTGLSQAIPIAKNSFVRQVDSTTGRIWRGGDLNLADVVGGGNGFDSEEHSKSISMKDGSISEVQQGKYQIKTSVYVSVPDSKFVDGVFIPIGGKGPVQISSNGHVFKECPETTGTSWSNIRNSGALKLIGNRSFGMELDGQPCGTPENPAIFLHPNAGITFDLEAIRRSLPNLELKAFRSRCGISSNAYDVAKLENITVDGELTNTYAARKDLIAKADFYVLVDGELKTTASLSGNPETILNLDIKLNRQDRFLTLVATQGNNDVSYDWVIFSRPHLMLGAAE